MFKVLFLLWKKEAKQRSKIWKKIGISEERDDAMDGWMKK